MYKPIILPLARQDIKEAAQWYNERLPGLGYRFLKNIRKKVTFISKNPQAVAVRYDNVRVSVLETFPYMVHFVIDDEKKQVIISAVISTYRDPGIWKDR